MPTVSAVLRDTLQRQDARGSLVLHFVFHIGSNHGHNSPIQAYPSQSQFLKLPSIPESLTNKYFIIIYYFSRYLKIQNFCEKGSLSTRRWDSSPGLSIAGRLL